MAKEGSRDRSTCGVCSGSCPDGDGKLLECCNEKSPGNAVFKMVQVAIAKRLAGGQEETPHAQLGEEGTQHASGVDSDYCSVGYDRG